MAFSLAKGGDKIPSLKNNLGKKLRSSQASEVYENFSGKYDSQRSDKMKHQNHSEKDRTGGSNFSTNFKTNKSGFKG